MKAKSFGTILALCSVLFLAGCNPSITNLTSEQVPQNASGIYTLSMAVSNDNGSVITKSYKPAIVIDGQTYPMRQSAVGRNIFEYDYRMPEGRNQARFYYLLDYNVDYNGKPTSRQAQSGTVHSIKLVSRYVLTLESLRGPVGAQIAVVGRGFQPSDRIVLGGYQTETNVLNGNSLNFRVPPLPANRAYLVQLVSPEGTISVGNFYIDASLLQASPQVLQLAQGQKSILTLRLANPAPEGGLRIVAQTDIPSSIIMPEVTVRSGQTTVTVPVEGGNPGKGVLYLTAAGYSRVEIPVTVEGGSAPAPVQPTLQADVSSARASEASISDARVTQAEVSEGQAVPHPDPALNNSSPVNLVNEAPLAAPSGSAAPAATPAPAASSAAPAATATPSTRALPSQTSENIITDGDGNVILQQSDLIPVSR